MNPIIYFLILALLSIAAWWYGRRHSLRLVQGDRRRLHSMPRYYGYYAALWTVVPALLMLLLWLFLDQGMITRLVSASLPDEVRQLPADELGLYLNDVINLARGNIISTTEDAGMRAAAAHYRHLLFISRVAQFLVMAGLVMGGLALALHRIRPDFRARPRVERLVRWLLIISSSIAILTTLGIVLSVLFEALRFFRIIPVTDFLFGLQWSPQM
ncbi:phosphate ABC transporter permease family protein, partial [Thiolapillus sp.]